VEDNVGQHQQKALELQREQARMAFEADRNASVSTLQAIGGGGTVGAGSDPHLQVANQQKDLLRDIKDSLAHMAGGVRRESYDTLKAVKVQNSD
jgi:hypothetical protein